MLAAEPTCLLLHPSACCCTQSPVTAPLPDTCDQGDREFYAEVALLTRLRHPNLVCIMGMCDEDGTKLGAPGAAGLRGVRCRLDAASNLAQGQGVRLGTVSGGAVGQGLCGVRWVAVSGGAQD